MSEQLASVINTCQTWYHISLHILGWGQNLVLCTHQEAKGKGAVSLKHRTVIWVQNEDPSDLEKVTFVHYVISW